MRQSYVVLVWFMSLAYVCSAEDGLKLNQQVMLSLIEKSTETFSGMNQNAGLKRKETVDAKASEASPGTTGHGKSTGGGRAPKKATETIKTSSSSEIRSDQSYLLEQIEHQLAQSQYYNNYVDQEIAKLEKAKRDPVESESETINNALQIAMIRTLATTFSLVQMVLMMNDLRLLHELLSAFLTEHQNLYLDLSSRMSSMGPAYKKGPRSSGCVIS